MPNWIFTVIHQNGLQARGTRVMDGPGIGQVVIVHDLECSCDHKHTLVGTEHMDDEQRHMSGKGHESVSPENDPGSEPSPKDDDVPSWDGGPGHP